MLHNRFLTALLGCVLFFTFFTAVPVNAKSIVLNKAVLTDFFEGISIEINKPIVVSRKAELFEVSGEIDVTDPYKAIETVCNKTNLIWYDNGSAIYVYLSSELKSEFVPIATENDFQQIVKFLKLSNLYSLTYPLRYTKGAGYVSGPPMYITVVRDAVAAYYNGLAADEKPTAKKEIEVIKMFPLRNRFVTDMRYMIRGAEKVVEGALSILNRLMAERPDLPKNVTIVADPLNNAIYIRALAKDLSELETLINEIDVIREQIQLSLWIIDIDSSEIKEIGTSLEGKISNDVLNIGLNGGSVILDQSQTLSFVGAVNLLESDKKAKVLSRPVLITQNNTPAVIDTNETIYVRLLGERDVSLKEITYGTILSVTPRVVKGPTGNDIEMMVEIEDGNQTAALIDGIPNIRRSVISTVGRISDSQSLLLGGFVRKEVSSVNRGVPVLKNIPVLKYLFSMDVQNTSSVMRLFMIEPKIVEDPVAEFNRSKIINLQSEPFFKAPKAKDPFSVTSRSGASQQNVLRSQPVESNSITQTPRRVVNTVSQRAETSPVAQKVVPQNMQIAEQVPVYDRRIHGPVAPVQQAPQQRAIALQTNSKPVSVVKPYAPAPVKTTDTRVNANNANANAIIRRETKREAPKSDEEVSVRSRIKTFIRAQTIADHRNQNKSSAQTSERIQPVQAVRIARENSDVPPKKNVVSTNSQAVKLIRPRTVNRKNSEPADIIKAPLLSENVRAETASDRISFRNKMRKSVSTVQTENSAEDF